MTGQWTPGPWFADPDGRPGMEWNWHVCTSEDDRICFMSNGPNSEANATLIAAAPDMAEALADIIPPNLCTTNPNVRDDVIVPMEVTMGELRKIAAALAKAGAA